METFWIYYSSTRGGPMAEGFSTSTGCHFICIYTLPVLRSCHGLFEAKIPGYVSLEGSTM